MKAVLYRAAFTCLTLLFGSLTAHADITQFSSMSQLVPNDIIHWATLGPDLTALTPPIAVTTQGGRSATVSGPPDGSAAYSIFSGATYNADFLPTDTVISAFDLNTFTALTSGIQIDFAIPVFGVGAQIQADFFGPFMGTLEAFDASHTSLGSVNIGGTVVGNGDGSAPFLGLGSTTPISEIVFTSDQPGVAINDLGINTVPEPTAIALLGTAIALIAIRRRRA